ncbi:MAG: hypothetical protein R3305_05590, partial [Gammaproteobacteria bacterium]|nr:hypothetical protein [Gammaproteobacteria bacterium]
MIAAAHFAPHEEALMTSTRLGRRPLSLALLTVAAWLPAGGASAQGWLAGGALGSAQQHDYELGGPIATRDDSDTAYRLFGGYMISPIQGLVMSY